MATQVRIDTFKGDRTLSTTRSGNFVVGDQRPDVDPAGVAATDFVSSGGNGKDGEIDSLDQKLHRFYNKFGAKDEGGKPLHSPSQIKRLAHSFVGQIPKLNEGLAAKYKKSLADLSDSDDGGSMAEATSLL